MIVHMLTLCLLLGCAGVTGVPSGELRAEVFTASNTYSVESTVLLISQGRDLGWRLRSKLHVEPAWRDHSGDFLLAFRLQEPQLLMRGKEIDADYKQYGSLWDSYQDSEFYARWTRGVIREAYFDATEPPDVINYKRALLSLFQFQLLDGEHNETDVSGVCEVLYETSTADSFRKFKRNCADELAGGARRVTRYTLGGGAGLRAVHADEVVVVGEDRLALKARSLHVLALLDHSAAPPAATSPEHALPAQFTEAPITLPLVPPPDDIDTMSIEAAVAKYRKGVEGEEAGEGGEPEAAEALLRLMPALRAAGRGALLALVQARAGAGLARALGLAGTGAAAAAARAALFPGAGDTHEHLARRYLTGLALSPAPQRDAAAAALALAEDARASRLAAAALLAAAAASSRIGDDAFAAKVRDTITKSLARCKDDECRISRLRALGNTGAAEVAETLVAHAERGGARAAEVALGALAALPRLAGAHVHRVAALVSNSSRSLEERAAALELVAERDTRGAALPLTLADAARALCAERGAAAHELRRVLWARLAALQHRPAAAALARALPPQLRGWDARAAAGTSSVLVREPGWAAAGWRAELDSRQLAARGLLRRGRVALRAGRPGEARELLGVEVWTRGLAAVAGGAAADEGDPAEEPETPAAGLTLSVGDVALPDLQLFEGQAELLGHIWAGTGSADTAVVRAALVRGGGAARRLAGGAVARVASRGAALLALDARASVSLWQRSARAAMTLRGGGAALAHITLHTQWARVTLEARAHTDPRLRIHADLDFYEDVALCVRAATEPHTELVDVHGELRGGASKLKVSWSRSSRVARPGRTLSLGRKNDVTCRTLRSADED